jgi:hypothetical protein
LGETEEGQMGRSPWEENKAVHGLSSYLSLSLFLSLSLSLLLSLSISWPSLGSVLVTNMWKPFGAGAVVTHFADGDNEARWTLEVAYYVHQCLEAE